MADVNEGKEERVLKMANAAVNLMVLMFRRRNEFSKIIIWTKIMQTQCKKTQANPPHTGIVFVVIDTRNYGGSP